ncbi:MAG: diguanylate cyclase [Chloroflexota bacterium]
MRDLRYDAQAYMAGVILLGNCSGAAVLILNPLPSIADLWIWLTFAWFTGLAAISQVFNVTTIKNQACCISLAFFFAALILLDYPLLVLSVVIMFIPDWVKNRRRFYVQAFNIANFILAGIAARYVYVHITDGSAVGSRAVLGIMAAIGAFTLMNHIMLIAAVHLAREVPWRDSILLQSDSLLIDTGLAGLGASLATLWRVDPWLVVIGAYPLLLIYRSLDLPNLRRAAITDSKTNLFNFKHFTKVLQEELHRAARHSRPLAVLMADLDLLRNINNTYGHLAGDEVLEEVARIISRHIRQGDVAARFGGEEFAVLLVDTGPEQAAVIANRICEQVASQQFHVSTASHPVRASLSVGVAAYPEHGTDITQLIHQADVAVRWAKISGRNRVCVADPAIHDLLAHRRYETTEEQESWRYRWLVTDLFATSQRSQNGASRVLHLVRQLEEALRG